MNKTSLPDLDLSVLAGLDFHAKQELPKLKLKPATRFVVGSVNAFNTGLLLFASKGALFADESDFNEKLKLYRPLIKDRTVKEAIIISASGEKDSIWEVKAARRAGLKTILFTCDGNSTAAGLADEVAVFPKSPEPYSYNFSTYLGMMLAVTGEKTKDISSFLDKIKLPNSFKKASFFTFVLPDRFKAVAKMINVKDDELFGPYSCIRAYNEGQARHAKFIATSPQELIISFGKNELFGQSKQRWEIELPKKADCGLIFSLAYYLVGLIQRQKPDHFKAGLPNYCKITGPKAYGRKEAFQVIVE